MIRKCLVFVMLLAMLAPALTVSAQNKVEITIATVNHPDMVVMQSFTSAFEDAYPNIKLNWVVLPENELRARVTTDIATGASSFDIVTVGAHEVPIWAENGWIHSVDGLFDKSPPSPTISSTR